MECECEIARQHERKILRGMRWVVDKSIMINRGVVCGMRHGIAPGYMCGDVCGRGGYHME